MMRGIIIFTVILFTQLCLAQSPGDDCSNPITAGMGEYFEPYLDNNYTCGRGNNAAGTCLGNYDEGEDIFYEITIEIATYYYFQLDPQGTPWTAMALSLDCPPTGSTYDDCLAHSFSNASMVHSFEIFLDVGTYYLMIDTWPAPECIPSFELTITDVLIDIWGTCEQPFYISLPNDTPYEEFQQSTCFGWDNYDNTCLGYYDGGRDLIYELEVTRPGHAIIRLDPLGTAYTGIALGNTCPPTTDGTGECLAVSTSISAEAHGLDLDLVPGNYYLMVDSWPAPDCIPEYDLSVSFRPAKLCGDVNDDLAVNVSDAVYIINYIFISGDVPVIYNSGDANCDESTNVSDAVMIINYIFIDGNTPCDIDGDGENDC